LLQGVSAVQDVQRSEIQSLVVDFQRKTISLNASLRLRDADIGETVHCCTVLPGAGVLIDTSMEEIGVSPGWVSPTCHNR
jgi:hypothetical protein